VLLYPDECPLARAISSKKVPRFVLRTKDENSNSVDLNETPTKKEKRKKLFSFSRNSEDKPEKEKKVRFPKGKKGKIDKSAISVQINHLEESTVSESETEISKLNGSSENLADLTFPESEEDISLDQNANNNSTTISLDSEPEDTPLIDTDVTLENSPIDDETDEPKEVVIEPSIDGENNDDIAPLRTSTIDFKRKLSFSNSSVFFEQDNDPPVLEKKKARKKKDKVEKKKKSTKSTSRTKSFSQMVRGNKKKTENDPSVLTELSTYKLAPGILKVFGDHVSEGSNYKAVRASTISTSQEVVRMALERYGLENCNPKDFVLCDVVGQFSNIDASSSGKKKGSKKEKQSGVDENEKEEPKWITEYVRAINDNEKPLVLQSLWKPTNGRSRRFELRKRIEVESSCFFINTADGMGRSLSESSLFNDSEHSSIGNDTTDKTEYASVQMSPHTNSRKITKTGRQDNQIDNKAPQYSPYLLLLNGIDTTKDQLIHKLEDPTVVVGAYVESEIKQCNIMLYSSDILLPHCWIFKKVKLEEDSSETNLDEINFLIFLEPANGADITVNGLPITSTTLLKPGHLVSLGRNYLFIFKDPTQAEIKCDRLSWWGSIVNPDSVNTHLVRSADDPNSKATKAVGVQVESLKTDDESDEHSDDSDDDDEESNSNETQSNMAARRRVSKCALQLSYSIKNEEELLHSIIDIADQGLGGKYFPVHLIVFIISNNNPLNCFFCSQ